MRQQGARAFAEAGLAAASILACLVATSSAVSAEDSDAAQKLRQAVNSPARSSADKARDPYRHPVETLSFFGIRPDMTVVEVWPFGGWYTAILAPYLREHGKLYAAAMDPDSKDAEDLQYNRELHALFAAHPQLFDKVELSVLAPGKKMQLAPDGSADMVLTFRNIHNWVWSGTQKEVFAADVPRPEARRDSRCGGASQQRPELRAASEWAGLHR